MRKDKVRPQARQVHHNGHVTYRLQIYERLSVYPETSAVELANLFGCSLSTAGQYARIFRDNNAIYEHSDAECCARCSARGMDNNPVIDELCLWCRIEMSGACLPRVIEEHSINDLCVLFAESARAG